MTSAAPETDSLNKLQSSKQVALLDAIDKLRNQGVNHGESFPQLIVCGDQSSGKSSVLEGITRLTFPTKEGLCTTFATEVVLRKEDVVNISCCIIPGRGRTQAQIRELSKFKRSFPSQDDLPFINLVEEAKERMMMGTGSTATQFFDDVLQIRYVGPDVPCLTIVDLPGLIQSQLEGNMDEGVHQVHKLVDRYMQDGNSIILAVVSARNDLENQAVFKKVKAVDPQGARSLGIITKPDLLDAGSETENRFVKLAKNEIVALKLGWHVVKNRTPRQSQLSHAERDLDERKFFDTSAWKSLARSDVGINALRSKLSEMLLSHICKELPTIIVAIREAAESTEDKLATLGHSRETEEQQRLYLTKIAESFQKLTDNAMGGVYNDQFFALSTTGDRNPSRLRTEIQNLNIAFAHTMYRKGHAWEILDDHHSFAAGPSLLLSNAIQEYDAAIDDPERITRAEFLQHNIGEYVRQSRPSGLPSLVNPWVIGEVFRHQSERWEHMAEHHLGRVFHAVREYIDISLRSLLLADTRTYSMIMLEQINPELDEKEAALKAKLKELIQPYRMQDPITYDPTFVLELNDIRARRYGDANTKTVSRQKATIAHSYQNALLLADSLDDYTNSEILDLMQTYYKKAISVFISNITVLAVENCLLSNLGDILSPSLVSSLNVKQLELIASEPEDIRNERASLTQRLADLRAGKRVLDIQACNSQTAVATASPPSIGRFTPKSRFSSQRPPRPRTPTPNPHTGEQGLSVEHLATDFNRLAVTPPPGERRRASKASSPNATPTRQSGYRTPTASLDRARKALASDTEDEEVDTWTANRNLRPQFAAVA